MALTQDRNTPYRRDDFIVLPVEANTAIYAGALVAVNAAGRAVPGAAATGLRAAGRAEEQVINNPGAAGAKSVLVRRGVFKYNNDAANPVTAADLLANCYIVDDQTVAATDGGGTRSLAGKVLQVDPDGVWVEIQ